MKKLLTALVSLLLLCMPITAYAHSGGTDAAGGHYDNETGDYHYHHGYSAHEHYDMDGDGIRDCPYDFHDATDNNNTGGFSTSSSVSSLGIASSSTSTSKSDNVYRGTFFDFLGCSLSNAGVSFVILAWIFLFICVYYKISIKQILLQLFFLSVAIGIQITIIDVRFSDLKGLWVFPILSVLFYILILRCQRNKMYRPNYIKYENKTKTEIYNMLNSTQIDVEFNRKNKPILKHPDLGRYGEYTGYVSNRGIKIHYKQGCSAATKPVNILNTYRTECMKCRKYNKTGITYQQYSDFKDTMKEIKRLRIKIADLPQTKKPRA